MPTKSISGVYIKNWEKVAIAMWLDRECEPTEKGLSANFLLFEKGFTRGVSVRFDNINKRLGERVIEKVIQSKAGMKANKDTIDVISYWSVSRKTEKVSVEVKLYSRAVVEAFLAAIQPEHAEDAVSDEELRSVARERYGDED